MNKTSLLVSLPNSDYKRVLKVTVECSKYIETKSGAPRGNRTLASIGQWLSCSSAMLIIQDHRNSLYAIGAGNAHVRASRDAMAIYNLLARNVGLKFFDGCRGALLSIGSM